MGRRSQVVKAGVCKIPIVGSIPTVASAARLIASAAISPLHIRGGGETADAADLKSAGAKLREGSIPSRPKDLMLSRDGRAFSFPLTQLDDLPLVLLGLSAADWQKRHLLVTSQAAPAVPVPAESREGRGSRGSGYGAPRRQGVLSPEPLCKGGGPCMANARLGDVIRPVACTGRPPLHLRWRGHALHRLVQGQVQR